MSYGAAGTAPATTNAGTGTTALAALALPACRNGDLLLMAVWCRPSTATITTPVGWLDVPNGELTGGFGAEGLDTGPTRLKVMYRVSPPLAAQAVSLASSPNACMGVILSCRTSIVNGGYTVQGASGTKDTGGTPYNPLMTTDPGITTNDFVAVFTSWSSDTPTMGTPTFTAAGLTSGTVTEIAEARTTRGNDMGGGYHRFVPTAGPSSAAGTFSVVVGGTATNAAGPTVIVRVREVAADAQMPVTPVQQLVAA